MKKRTKILISLILAGAASISILLYYHHSFIGGDVSNVKRTVTATKVYSEQDISCAMDVVETYFKKDDFKGCTLTDLWYDDSISASESGEWAKQYNADEAIVLLSNFNVDSSGGDGSFNPNSTYKKWDWILVRSNGGRWVLKTWGYG